MIENYFSLGACNAKLAYSTPSHKHFTFSTSDRRFRRFIQSDGGKPKKENNKLIQDALDRLVCPQTLAPLELRSFGSLHCPSSGKTYPVRGGIARFVDGVGIEQQQVNDCFSIKWKKAIGGITKATKVRMKLFSATDFVSSDEDLKSFFYGKTVLHAGVGNGHIEQYYLHHCKQVWGVDISESVDALAANWMKYYPNLARRFLPVRQI